MRRRRCTYIASVCVIVWVYYFFGLGDYLMSKSFDNDFDYPLNINIIPLVKEVMSGKKPSVAPINLYPYRFLTNSGKCKTLEKLDLFIVVKSAMANFAYRDAIRQTYGQEYSIAGRIMKVLFFLGIGDPKTETQKKIEEEMSRYKDIIQIDFRDNYYNNTIKTMMSLRWVYEHCSTADYYLFTDDDMYVSVSNLLDYVQTPTSSEAGENEIALDPERDRHLFTGYIFNSGPQRFKSSKWWVPLEEYPWNKWPSYVTAGAYVLSNKSMKWIYIGSLFVKHFRFDDIYLGLVAKKIGITPVHCKQIYYYKKPYTKEGYKEVIASHGYDDHEDLIRVWNEQNKIV